MNEEEPSGLSDLLRPDTTWEAYFQVKLEPDSQPLDGLVSLEAEVSTSRNGGDCSVSTTSTLPNHDLSVSSSLTRSLSYKLNAPTSGCVRKGECSLTFLNKDQLYGFRIEYESIGERGLGLPGDFILTTLISLQFPIGSSDLDPVTLWKIWASKQPKLPNQALKVDAPSTTTEVVDIQEVALNAVKVQWSPHERPVELFLSVSCLSTDFTNQKGVKGIPVMLQVDTQCSTQKSRAVAKIKTFCDKGADRKLRQEERRLSKFTPPYPCESSKPFTSFTKLFPPFEDPFLFNPPEEDGIVKDLPRDQVSLKERREPEAPKANNFVLDTDYAYRGTVGQFSHRKLKVLSEEPFLHVRQESESTFTGLHLDRLSLDGLIASISSRYQIEVYEIRRVYLRSFQGFLIHVDQDYVRALARSLYLMKILVIDNTHIADNTPFDQARPKYDIILCEMSVS